MKLIELENPGYPVKVQMADPMSPRPYLETSIHREMYALQLPDTRYAIDQVVPSVTDTEEGTCVIVYKRYRVFQEFLSKMQAFPAAWWYWYLKFFRNFNDACVNRIITGSFSEECLAPAQDSTWNPETWEVSNPHATVADTYFDDHAADGIDIDKLDMSQMLEDKEQIDKVHDSSVARVISMY